MSTWFYAPQLGQPRGGTPVSVMRQFAQTPQVAMCIKTIIDEISGIPYSIVPKQGYDDSFNEDIKLEIEEFLRYPNRNGESFDTIIKALLKDILEIDAGVIVKTFSNYSKEKQYSFTSYVAKDGEYPTVDIMAKALTTKAKLSEIYCRDAGTFVLNPNEFGILPEDKPAYFQYSWLNHSAKPLPFFKREIVYFNSTPRSNSPYGWSPIESLFMVLESLNNAVRFNKKSFEEYAIPDGALSVIGADKDSLARFIQQWKNDVKGKPHKLVIFNEDMKFTPFHQKNKDMEWLEGQKYYQRLVWAMYGVTPDELGFTETSNRSVGESQSRVFVRRAIKPFLQLLQTKITEDIIAEFYDGEIECEIKWDWIDQELEKEEQVQQREDVKTGILTINEVRLGRGLDPVTWGDENPNQPQQQGFDGFDFGDDSFDEFLSDEEELEKTIKKKDRIIEIGPRGGRIVDYDSNRNPIYERGQTISNLKELTSKEQAAVNWYKKGDDHGDLRGDEGYWYINKLLRTGKQLTYNEIKDITWDDKMTETKVKRLQKKTVQSIPLIDSAIKKNSLNQDIELYRGVGESPVPIDKIKPGMVFKDKGFISTSKVYGQAKAWMMNNKAKDKPGFVMKIQAKEGQKGYEFYRQKREAEVLLPRDTEFKVISVKSLSDYYNVVTVEIVNDVKKNYEVIEINSNNYLLKQPESLELPFKEPVGTKWQDWDDYGDFLAGYFNQLEKKVMEIFDEEMTNTFKGKEIWLRKDWGGFLAKITSLFAVKGLKEHIEKYIKKTWTSALNEVEDSLNIQIGIGDSDRALINQFAEQQTEGYVLPDGNKWLGIQGVNDKIQIQLGDIVQKGVEGGLSVDEVRKNIQLKLDTTRNHAMMIARTETNRIRNRAHLGAYMKSNIPGKIKWDAHLDNRTSEVCEELDGKKVNPGDLFITKDGQEFAYPPAHVNCRSRIVFVPEALEEFEDETE
jgi:HK97 family phage portal protein|tara:strand:- start:1077 stop:3956 length:2880 start_codon:yes stop_codon:yes gene_type:complete